MSSTWGLCVTPRRLVASLQPADRVSNPVCHVARTDDGRHFLLDAIIGSGAELVVAADQMRKEPVAELARARGVTLWLIPPEVAFAIRVGAGLHAAPRRLAAIMAQLPSMPLLRPHLKRLRPVVDRRQLALL
jgi:hypothetical protein